MSTSTQTVTSKTRKTRANGAAGKATIRKRSASRRSSPKEATQHQPIPLEDLIVPLRDISGPSPRNIRKTTPSPESVASLAAVINNQGLQLPLLLEYRADDSQPYTVLAGGQRWHALMRNAKDPASKIGPETLIPCRIPLQPIDDDTATHISLAENETRVALNPIDASDAYTRLYKRGLAPDDIASIMGITARMVRARLTLQALHPEIRQAGIDGTLNYSRLAAYAACPDTAQQHAYFAAADISVSPDQIRSALLGNALRASDPRVAFVTIPHYIDSGGTFQRDLFTAEDGSQHTEDSILADPELLHKLTEDKLHKLENALSAKGWAWTASYPSHHAFLLEKIPYTSVQPEKGNKFSASERGRLGAVIHIDDTGNVIYTYGLVDPARTVPDPDASTDATVPDTPTTQGAAIPQGAAMPQNAAATPAPGNPSPAAPSQPGTAPTAVPVNFNRSLLQDLAHVRRAELHTAALANPRATAAWAFAEASLRLAGEPAPLAASSLEPAHRYHAGNASAPLIASARQTAAKVPPMLGQQALADLFLDQIPSDPLPAQIVAVAAAYASAITDETASRPDAACAFARWIGYDWKSWRPPVEFWLRIPRTDLGHILCSHADTGDHATILQKCATLPHRRVANAIYRAITEDDPTTLEELSLPKARDILDKLRTSPAPGYQPAS